jgi:hypothetical protein
MTRIGKIVATAASITLMLVVTASSAAALEELRSANVAEVRDGYRISWLQGHSVINDQNEMIGTISEFVVDRDLAIFAILQVGEFIGLRAISWRFRSRRWSSTRLGCGSNCRARRARRSKISPNSGFPANARAEILRKN